MLGNYIDDIECIYLFVCQVETTVIGMVGLLDSCFFLGDKRRRSVCSHTQTKWPLNDRERARENKKISKKKNKNKYPNLWPSTRSERERMKEWASENLCVVCCLGTGNTTMVHRAKREWAVVAVAVRRLLLNYCETHIESGCFYPVSRSPSLTSYSVICVLFVACAVNQFLVYTTRRVTRNSIKFFCHSSLLFFFFSIYSI